MSTNPIDTEEGLPFNQLRRGGGGGRTCWGSESQPHLGSLSESLESIPEADLLSFREETTLGGDSGKSNASWPTVLDSSSLSFTDNDWKGSDNELRVR